MVLCANSQHFLFWRCIFSGLKGLQKWWDDLQKSTSRIVWMDITISGNLSSQCNDSYTIYQICTEYHRFFFMSNRPAKSWRNRSIGRLSIIKLPYWWLDCFFTNTGSIRWNFDDQTIADRLKTELYYVLAGPKFLSYSVLINLRRHFPVQKTTSTWNHVYIANVSAMRDPSKFKLLSLLTSIKGNHI